MTTVCIVEDSEADLEALGRVLGEEGAYRIVEARSGEEGLALVDKDRPDCILLDYRLCGEVDGLAFMSRLPVEEGRVAIPVVMLTAYGDEDLAVASMKTGAMDYLAKRTDNSHLKLLRQRVEHALREHAEWRARRAAERALRQLNEELELRVERRTAQLEATLRELESLTYAIAHDLRTPLRAINGFSQALREESHDRLNEEQRGYLDRVAAAAVRMGELIDRLSGLSGVFRAPLHCTELDLSAMARAAAERLRQSAPERQVEFVIAEGVRGLGDPRLMGVVIEQLFANAWRHVARTPHARIEVGGREEERRWRYFVRDNGAGFDMAFAGKLFRPFHPLHREEAPGSGTGLATVHSIVARHGGEVWAEGAVGKGATFHFTLPLRCLENGQ